MKRGEWLLCIKGDDRVKTPDAAYYLGVSTRTMEDWRMKGRGPRYMRIGHSIRYDTDDLIAFVKKYKQTG